VINIDNVTLLLYNGTFTSISLLLYSIFQSKEGLTKEWGQIFSFILVVIHSIAVLLSFLVDIYTASLLFLIVLLDTFGIGIIHYMFVGLIKIHMSEIVDSKSVEEGVK